MKLRSNKKFTSWLLCIMLIVAMAFTTVGCGEKNQGTGNQPSTQNQGTEAPKDTQEEQAKVVGEGETKFLFTVVDKDGNESKFEVHTDKKTVGEALLDVELIAGEDGDYGLYVKTVNGITADYDVDGTYWAFYVNDAYASSGVDTTTIEEGANYSFKVEK